MLNEGSIRCWLFPYRGTVNTNSTISHWKHRYNTILNRPYSRWRDIVQCRFKLGIQTTCTKAMSPNYHFTQPMLCWCRSRFDGMRDVLHQVWNTLEQVSLIYLLCFVRRQKPNWERKCKVSTRAQIQQLDLSLMHTQIQMFTALLKIED